MTDTNGLAEKIARISTELETEAQVADDCGWPDSTLESMRCDAILLRQAAALLSPRVRESALLEERDEMLTALKNILEDYDAKDNWMERVALRINSIRTLVAKVEGQS